MWSVADKQKHTFNPKVLLAKVSLLRRTLFSVSTPYRPTAQSVSYNVHPRPHIHHQKWNVVRIVWPGEVFQRLDVAHRIVSARRYHMTFIAFSGSMIRWISNNFFLRLTFNDKRTFQLAIWKGFQLFLFHFGLLLLWLVMVTCPVGDTNKWNQINQPSAIVQLISICVLNRV